VSQLIFFSKYCECVYLDKSDGPPVPTSVVPLGAYEVFRAWEIHSVAEDHQTVLFFGRLSAYKGLHVLLDAAPLVAREIPNVHFIIAGAPVPGYVVPDIPVLPNGARIEMMMQFIPPDLLCELFQRTALVVLPYTSATQSGVVMTACAFHKPIITTHVGGLSEVVSDGVTGRLVSPHDPVALAKAIIDLLRDSGLRAQMARNIRCRMENELSWDRSVGMTMSVYQSVL
jgi:glycosyltransferase involved in cell wall biosynthesis